jgi:predicted membrane channel-forming protein YqfA (hemolysin III family)
VWLQAYVVGVVVLSMRYKQFNSHQWWHLLVVCGTLVHWSNCLLIYDNYLKLLSFCPADSTAPLPW